MVRIIHYLAGGAVLLALLFLVLYSTRPKQGQVVTYETIEEEWGLSPVQDREKIENMSRLSPYHANETAADFLIHRRLHTLALADICQANDAFKSDAQSRLEKTEAAILAKIAPDAEAKAYFEAAKARAAETIQQELHALTPQESQQRCATWLALNRAARPKAE